MIAGDLPPSSSDTFFKLPAAAWTISLPTSVDPVNAILSTSGWAASAAPAVSPKPGGILNQPGRKAALLNQLGQAQRGHRRLLGRFQDDRAARRERRCDLPGRHEERKIPR